MAHGVACQPFSHSMIPGMTYVHIQVRVLDFVYRLVVLLLLLLLLVVVLLLYSHPRPVRLLLLLLYSKYASLYLRYTIIVLTNKLKNAQIVNTEGKLGSRNTAQNEQQYKKHPQEVQEREAIDGHPR